MPQCLIMWMFVRFHRLCVFWLIFVFVCTFVIAYMCVCMSVCLCVTVIVYLCLYCMFAARLCLCVHVCCLCMWLCPCEPACVCVLMLTHIYFCPSDNCQRSRARYLPLACLRQQPSRLGCSCGRHTLRHPRRPFLLVTLAARLALVTLVTLLTLLCASRSKVSSVSQTGTETALEWHSCGMRSLERAFGTRKCWLRLSWLGQCVCACVGTLA